MNTYRCRCTKRTKKWAEWDAETPEEAAALHAEWVYLQWPDFVTIMNHGHYDIFEESVFTAQKKT